MPSAAFKSVDPTPVELWDGASSEEKAVVINAIYKQVLGNPHLMESERLVEAESKFKDGSYSVRDFVRAVAKSSQYRSRFFETSAPYRFVELNFKHLLGRAPLDRAELSEHIQCCVNEGYDAEIDSYIDSDEYQQNFGENTVPYYCWAMTSQVGQKQATYNRLSELYQGVAGSDKAVKSAKLVAAIAGNSATKITGPSNGGRLSPYSAATDKTFKIVVSTDSGSRRRRCNEEYLVSGAKMTPQIQRICRSKGRILSITEVS
ncbi:phycobilisome rod-core linker polypeptide [Synechococcus sp. PCC 7336]|uniref:phycobilisome rod-core linker polypeptide n=1 Tax=Synechococcus sp. PCC 7336 TaxID=195250 RepID=UPI0003499F31|nr:phycobilisome rod-core linker polypeptide [Synechococcus sp. PCC 7336]